QAKEGVRDAPVTGVQTCALPIFAHSDPKDTSSIEELTTRADNLMFVPFFDIHEVVRSCGQFLYRAGILRIGMRNANTQGKRRAEIGRESCRRADCIADGVALRSM